MTQIKVFGNEAKEIKDGDLLVASKDSVEGRDVIILTPISFKKAEEHIRITTMNRYIDSVESQEGLKITQEQYDEAVPEN